jgi:hypothetical protein
MKIYAKISGLIIIVLTIAFTNAFGQETGDEFFASAGGGFRINLPKNFSSTKDVELSELGMTAIGKEYLWEKENEFFYQIEFIEFQTEKKSLTAVQKKALLATFRDGLAGVAKEQNNPSNEKPFAFNGIHPGIELQTNYLFSKMIYRFFIVNKIFYVLGAMVFNPARDEARARQVLDSFRLLDRQEIIALKVREATPEPLPQSPPAPKPKSDAEDEGLRGKVKSVIEESLPWSRRKFPNRRETESETLYNEQGNKIKRTTYSNNVPYDIDVYGYLDNMRVSRNGFVDTEYSGVMRASAISSDAPSAPKPADERYHSRYEYKYENGFLKEELVYFNDGDLSSRIVHNRNGNKTEQLYYDKDGKIHLRYIFLLDAKGNIIEEHGYDKTGKKIEPRYSYKYEAFDAQGNWTKRVVSEWKNRAFVPTSITYRTITYYP